jgi:hypothetical protein
MKIFFNEGNQIHNIISSSGSGTVINYGSGYGSDSDSGSTSQKVTVPTVPVPQHWSWYRSFAPFLTYLSNANKNSLALPTERGPEHRGTHRYLHDGRAAGPPGAAPQPADCARRHQAGQLPGAPHPLHPVLTLPPGPGFCGSASI